MALLAIALTVVWSAGGAACLIAAAWLQTRRKGFGPARGALVAALSATGVWAASAAVTGTGSGISALAESLRNLTWIFALYRLFANDGRHAAMKPVRPMLLALVFAELLQAAALVLMGLKDAVLIGAPALRALISLRLLVAIGGLVLLHNLYAGAAAHARLALRWPAMALAALWIADLTFYAFAYPSGLLPEMAGALRCLLALPVAALIALGAGDGSESLRFQPSRAVTFQSISLLLAGAYVALMAGAAQWFAVAGRDSRPLLQLTFFGMAATGVLVIGLSARLRGWLRVTLVKNLFQHRYDYRAEWLRFTRTIGQAGGDAASLNERVIRALADIADSPAGLLLVPGETGDLELSARWRWPEAEVPAVAMTLAQCQRLERDAFIADIDSLRGGQGDGIDLPGWLVDDPRAWALVPLLHFDRLAGIVVLARPAHVRKLDWEDFDLLRVVGRQLASYLAENAGQAALAEAGQFDAFHRRIAFVMHDIKNLASQLGLLARNAELHAENPEFRADMLVTLRNSTDKLNALVARLSRYGAPQHEDAVPISTDGVVRAVVAQLGAAHPVVLVEESACEVAGNRDSLEQVLLHLVQNAIDASAPGDPVFVSLSHDGINATIAVIDSGCGMSPEYVRSRLFKPFDSTKAGGFGIGAFEARALIKAMHGRIEVESREGLGSRFSVVLPLAQTAALMETIAGSANGFGAKVG